MNNIFICVFHIFYSLLIICIFLILVPDGDSDNESSSSRISTSSDSRNGRHSKKLKLNESRIPSYLLHFLPPNVQFDTSFEPKSKNNKYLTLYKMSEEEDIPTDFILFCNHMLKQMFGLHRFDDRSLRTGL